MVGLATGRAVAMRLIFSRVQKLTTNIWFETITDYKIITPE